MKINIIVKGKIDDSFQLGGSKSENTLKIPSVKIPEFEGSAVTHNIRELIKSSDLILFEDIVDFLNLGLAVYTIDQTVSRESYGYYHWNRYFSIYLPVANIEMWENVRKELEETLSFLSGDKWIINLRTRKPYNTSEEKRKDHKYDKVCLFSGGLDSFIGAIDLLNDSNVALVSHHKKGGKEKSAQQMLLNKLKEKNKDKLIKDFLFYVQPRKKVNKVLGGEDSQRARSFLYIVLGIAIAHSLGDDIPLYIPENGLISLNISLTKTRQGTYSTKTTHPYFLQRISDILKKLSINNSIINPYQFNTKGEMIVNAINKNLVRELFSNTISCSKPNHYVRWHKIDKQCGHCVPCIIRRAALKKAGLDRNNDYVKDLLTFDKSLNNSIGSDLRAFKIAIYKYLTLGKLSPFELLKNGALPPENISDYLGVVKRGLKEVNDFVTNS
ncbi:MAG: Qat anti-phage system QueC-like protein QatC [Bacteroidales bacterium]